MADAGNDSPITTGLPQAVAPGHNVFEQQIAEGERKVESELVEAQAPATEVSSMGSVEDAASAAPPLPQQPDDLVTTGDEEPVSTAMPEIPGNLAPEVEAPEASTETTSLAASSSAGVTEEDLQRVQNQLFED